jgi:hypothetical protein
VASSFDEVKARSLPFPGRGVKVEEMIDWVVREVKAMSDIVWQLNNNFAILAIEGILNMLHNEGCRELGRPHGLSTSSDTSVLQDVPDDVRNLARRIVWRWWKTHSLPDVVHRLEVANATTVSDTDNWELTA